jgi:hypothetical protein
MGAFSKIMVATMVMALILLISPRLFLIILIMVIGVAVATVIELGREHFKGSIVFHRCCANVHWAFISFYILAYERLHPIRKIEPWQLAGAAIGVSFVLYLFATVNAYRLLAGGTPPAFFNSPDERRSVYCAAWSIGVALGYGWLYRRA